MDKTAHTELHRTFLIEKLPDPLTPASSHLQIFDNYIANTRLRLRRVRDPSTSEWTDILQQRIPSDMGHGISKLAEIYLNDVEYGVMKRFEGREIRKNRYFEEFDRAAFTFDIHLGPLWGLNTARVDFTSIKEMVDFEPPVFALFEVTGEPIFQGWNLVGREFNELNAAVAGLEPVRTRAELDE